MSTVIGGTTVADPVTPLTYSTVLVGEYGEAFSGATLLDYSSTKIEWEVVWEGLTAAEMSTIEGELVATQTTFSPPYTATVYNAWVKLDTLTKTNAYNGSYYSYGITVTIREA